MAFPTDTVWGVLARMDNKDACQRIYSLKGREAYKPLQILVRDLEAALSLADTSAERELFLSMAKQFWPGALTMVVKGKDTPNWISPTGLVGLRIPALFELREVLTLPLAATSLNLSGQPPVQSYAEATSFAVDWVCPGPNPLGLASSVVDLVKREVLREGAISEERLKEYLL